MLHFSLISLVDLLFLHYFAFYYFFSLQPRNYLQGSQRQSNQTSFSWIILMCWLRSLLRFLCIARSKSEFSSKGITARFGADVTRRDCDCRDHIYHSMSIDMGRTDRRTALVLTPYKCTSSSPCISVFNRHLKCSVYVAPWCSSTC